MSKLRCSAILFLLCFFGSSLASAASLSEKYKSWDKSPDAYFLTSEERAQWKKIRADADAEKFISDYFGRRSPDLPALLKERIAAADKYFPRERSKARRPSGARPSPSSARPRSWIPRARETPPDAPWETEGMPATGAPTSPIP